MSGIKTCKPTTLMEENPRKLVWVFSEDMIRIYMNNGQTDRKKTMKIKHSKINVISEQLVIDMQK